jgi:drug/metabolite transporter (DMT)-like permease
MTDNLRAILLMIATMAGFSLEDFFIKRASESVPVGQILVILGVIGTVANLGFARRARQPVLTRLMLTRVLILRNLAEITAMATGVTALTLIPLSLAASILQAAPLMVTLGAALVLKEQVGWRRWIATGIGLVGVLLILAPDGSGFQPAVILSVIATICIALRDLATRATQKSIGTFQLTFWGYALTIPAGIVLSLIMGEAWVMPARGVTFEILVAAALGIIFYFTLTVALRIGEASAVVPFRYTRLIFSFALGLTFLDESVSPMMLAGLVLVVASGLYTLIREARVSRVRPEAPGPLPQP